MPTPSPAQNSTVVTLTIESGGRVIDDAIPVVSVTVEKGVGRIPRAVLVLEDGDMPEGDFPVSSSSTFKPGADIRISAGFGGDEALIFQGIVVKHGIAMTGANVSTLVVECRDRAVAMTLGRRSRWFQDVTVSDVIQEIIGDYSLSARVDNTSTRFTELVQYDCSDWDYLVSAAESAGLLTMVEAGEVVVEAPDTRATPVLGVTWGVDLISFEAAMDARRQSTRSAGSAWDPAAQALARVEGRMTFGGSSLARVGSIVELAGVGDRFSGKVFVSSVLHEIAEGSWTTEVEFGMDPFSFAERKDLMSPPASGRTAGVSGLQIGVVKKLEGHPGGEPISSRRATPFPLADDNSVKALITREKLKVEFDDEKKVLSLVTPRGNRVVLSDEGKAITLRDQTGNVVEMNGSGITLKTPKDLVLDAQGTVTIKAGSRMDLEAAQDLQAQGLNVTCKGSSSFKGEGGSSASLEGGGSAVVKGAMVMIN